MIEQRVQEAEDAEMSNERLRHSVTPHSRAYYAWLWEYECLEEIEDLDRLRWFYSWLVECCKDLLKLLDGC